MRLQIANDRVDVGEYFFYERHALAHLECDKVASAFLRYFNKRVAGHILNALVSLCYIFQGI